MANRAYLYSANEDFSILRDISEWRSEIPLWFQILLGVEAKKELSIIWKYEHEIAISSNFKVGLPRFINFYKFLKTQPGVNGEKIDQYIAATEKFFEEHQDRMLDKLFMEGGEVYDLSESETYPIEKENEYQFSTIRLLSNDIDEILAQKYDNVFEQPDKYQWLKGVRENIDTLEPYWTHVTYFSFNKTGL